MKQRIELLDLWRSLAVVLMLVYHALYDLELFGVLAQGTVTRPWALGLRYVCSASFILISGAAVRFSRDPVRRGFFVFCAGLGVTAVTALLKLPVLFGILQLLGVCMMLHGLTEAKLRLRRGAGFVTVCTMLFCAGAGLTKCVQVNIKWLFPLGLRYEGFFSSDYYPLLPWGFLFLIGTALGEKLAQKARFRAVPGWMTFPGRHSLLIYLLHQPILYGLCWLIYG